MKIVAFIICFLFAKSNFCSNEVITVYYLDTCQNALSSQQINININNLNLDEMPNPVFKLFKKKQRLNKRITAAALAFPFPFGIVGLHRIYLGSKPYVPVVYIATLGGVFGILPFIDFLAITFDHKNFEKFKDNGQVFMWLNH